MTNSFFPAARKVFENPIVKWGSRMFLTALVAVLTTLVWPATSTWFSTRADTETVGKIDIRVKKLESRHEVDFSHLNSALGDDTGGLSEAEQVQWSLLRIKRLQNRLILETRARLGLEALLQMPDPRSEGARRVESLARVKYDDLVQRGEEPEVAAQKALEYIHGGDSR